MFQKKKKKRKKKNFINSFWEINFLHFTHIGPKYKHAYTGPINMQLAETAVYAGDIGLLELINPVHHSITAYSKIMT